MKRAIPCSPAWLRHGPTNRAQLRPEAVAGDVALIHVASMSNLFAALGWALVDLLAHPLEASRVAAGDRARPRRVPSSRSEWPSGRSWPDT